MESIGSGCQKAIEPQILVEDFEARLAHIWALPHQGNQASRQFKQVP